MEVVENKIRPIEQAMINMVNRERKLRGLKELRSSVHLSQIARKHSEVQLRNKDIFHESPEDGSTHGNRIQRDGYFFMSSAENVSTAPELEMSHTGLMNSPGHYKNIVGDWEEMGIGIEQGYDGQLYVTQLFANPVKTKSPKAIKMKWVEGIKKLRRKRNLPPIQFYDLESLNSIHKELSEQELSIFFDAACEELRKMRVKFSESRIFYFCGFNNTSSAGQISLIKNTNTDGMAFSLFQLQDGRTVGIAIILMNG